MESRKRKLALVMSWSVAVGCDGVGSYAAYDTDSVDKVAAEEVITAVADAYGTVVDRQRSARVVLGTWSSLEPWNARLATAIRNVAEEMDTSHPHAPWLLSFHGRQDGLIEVRVIDKEEEINCCLTFFVDVSMTEDSWKVRLAKHSGITHYFAPDRIVEDIEASERPFRGEIAK